MVQEGRATQVRADWLVADLCDIGNPDEAKEILQKRALEYLLSGVRLSPQDYALLEDESRKAFMDAQAKIDSEREAQHVAHIMREISKLIVEFLKEDK